MYGPVIQGKVVRLRPPKPDDASPMVRWFEDLEVTHFGGRRTALSIEMEKTWLETTAKDPTRLWVLEVDGQAVGTTVIREIDWKNGFGTTGTVIGDRSVWGKGHRPRDDAAALPLRLHPAAAAQVEVGYFDGQRGQRSRPRLSRSAVPATVHRWQVGDHVYRGGRLRWIGSGSMRS